MTRVCPYQQNSAYLDDFRLVKRPENYLQGRVDPEDEVVEPQPYRDLLGEFLKDLPTLPPPARLEEMDIALRMILSQQSEVGLTHYQIKDHCEEIDKLKEKKMALYALHSEKMREALAKANQSNAWGMFGKIITWVSSLTTIALGGAAIGTGAGTGAGVAMILSGAALLSTQLASEFGLFEKIAEELSGGDLKKKESILWHLMVWSMVATVGLSMGSMAIGYTTVFSSAVGGALMSTINGTMLVSKSVATLGGAFAESGKLESEGDSQLYGGRVTLVGQKLKELLDGNKSKVDRMSSWDKFLRQIIKTDAEKNHAINAMHGGNAAPAA